MVLPYDNMDYGEDQVGARNIPELTDVELINLANGEILKYNSSNNKWENQPESGGSSESIDSLTDTNITAPIINGSTLVYNTSNGKWENAVLVDIDTLNNLSDTNISSLADKDFLLYDNTSSKWINTPSIIDNLKNVNILSVANNEILKYNSISSKWENTNLNLNEIQDVNITSLQNGEVLKYNSTTNKWENQDNTDTLNELSDVNLVILLNNFVLKYDINNNEWYGNFVNLTELGDTNISTLNNGDILRYNSVSQKWETDTFNIDDLDNVNINSVANNEVLKYNSTSGKWENSNRIDTLDELGDVTLTGVTSNDLLRYNGSVWENTKIAFDNNFTNVNFTSLTNGDLIKYNGTNFINFSPTYLDGAGISDNYLIKVVGGATTQTSITETNTVNSTNITFNNGSIETEIFNTTKKRMHLTTDGIASTNGITITSDGRVGIGVVEPEEDLELDGNIQLDTGGVQRGRVIFYDKQNDHEHAEVDGLGEGTNGGVLAFYTKVDGGSVTEKLRINNQGAIGIGGANYGTTNQVLVSNDSGSSVSWANQTDTTYSAGTGVNLVGTEFSIGQPVATNDPVTFKNITLSRDTLSFPVEPAIFYDDPLNGGTLAQIQMSGDGLTAGKLQFYTKESGGSLTEKLTINNKGAIGIGGANYGSAGDVIISNGPNASVSYRSVVYLAAYKTSNTNVSFPANSGTTYIIRDMTIDYISDAGSYNTSTGEFTAPRQAMYVINYNANIFDNVAGGAYAGYISCEIKVDRGSGFVIEMTQNYYDKSLTTENFTPNVTYLTQLNAGDKVVNECSFYSTYASTVTIRGHSTSRRCTFQSIHSIT